MWKCLDNIPPTFLESGVSLKTSEQKISIQPGKPLQGPSVSLHLSDRPANFKQPLGPTHMGVLRRESRAEALGFWALPLSSLLLCYEEYWFRSQKEP